VRGPSRVTGCVCVCYLSAGVIYLHMLYKCTRLVVPHGGQSRVKAHERHSVANIFVLVHIVAEDVMRHLRHPATHENTQRNVFVVNTREERVCGEHTGGACLW
jgi:hypothetical protein